MSEWKTYKLAEIIQIIGGGTPKTTITEYWNGYIPWLSVVDFANGQKHVYNTEKTITSKGLRDSSTKLLQKGQIIISARGTVGALAVLGRDMAFNQSCYGIKANGKTDNDFLFYLLRNTIERIKKKTHGAVFDTITRQTFENIEVQIPEGLDEQRQIASILSSLDNKIELNLQMNQTLEAIAQAIFHERFGKYKLGDELPEGWRWARISDLTKNIQYGFTQSSTPDRIGPKFLRITDIQRGEINWDAVPYCLIDERDFNKYKIVDHDIFIARTGASTGENVYVLDPPEAVFASYLIRIQFDNPALACYVAKFLRRSEYSCYISSIVGGSAQPNANAKQLTAVEIILPPENDLTAYYKVVDMLNRRIINNEQENQNLSQLRDSILPRLMSGKIEVN